MARSRIMTTLASGTVWLLLLLLSIGFTLYAPSLNALRFEDDFAAYYDPLPDDPFYFFTHPAQYAFWRPLPGTLLLFTQRHFGHATWPIHVTNVRGHVLCGFTLFVVMRRMGIPSASGRFASLFFVVTQIGAFNVLGNDTSGQVWVVLFGCLAVWFAHIRRYALSTLGLILALLTKETSLVFVPILFLTAVVLRSKRSLADFGSLVPYTVLTILYFWVRGETGSMNILQGQGSYSWGVGLHNIANLAYFGFGLLLPASTVDAFVALRTDPGRFILFVLAALSFATLVVGGLLLTSGMQRRILAFLLLVLAASLPFALMHHVGEGYVNTALPFSAVLVGIAAGRLLPLAWQSRLGRGMTVVVLASFLLAHSHAVWSKGVRMRQNGKTAYRLLERLETHAQRVPNGGSMVLCHVASEDEIVYSTYNRPGFLLLGKNSILGTLLGRRDIDVLVVSEPLSLPPGIVPGQALVLTDRDGVIEQHQILWTRFMEGQ